MNRGYVKIYRKCLDGGLLRNAQTWQFLSWCLLKATHRPYKHLVGSTVINLEPGQFIFSRAIAARELASTERKIRTSIETLKNIGFLTTMATSKFSVITIVNWHTYQDERPAGDQLATSKTAEKRPQTNTIFKQTQDRREESYDSSCPEQSWIAAGPPPNNLPCIISLPLNTGEEHPVTQNDVNQWQELYPAVDVMQALRNMRGWLIANQQRRKTKSGIKRFVSSWLAKDQDRGGSLYARASPQTYRRPIATTQYQKMRQDAEDLAANLLAYRSYSNGIRCTDSDGAWPDSNPLPATNKRQ